MSPSDSCLQGWFSIEILNSTWQNASSVGSLTTPPIPAGSTQGASNISCVSISISDSTVKATESIATIAGDNSGANPGLGSHVRGGRISIAQSSLTLSDRYKPYTGAVAMTFPAYISGVIGTLFLGLGTVVGGQLISDLQVTVKDSSMLVEAIPAGLGAAAFSFLLPPGSTISVRKSTMYFEASAGDSLTLNVVSNGAEAVGGSILSNSVADTKLGLRVITLGAATANAQRPSSGIWVTGANRALALSMGDSLAFSPSKVSMTNVSIVSEGKFVIYSKGGSLLSASHAIASRRTFSVDDWMIAAYGAAAEISATGEFIAAAISIATHSGASLTVSRGTLLAQLLTVNATSTFTSNPSLQYCAITVGLQAGLHLTATDVATTLSNVVSYANAVDRSVAGGAISVLGNLERIENWSYLVFSSTLVATSGSAGRTCYSVAAGFASHDDTWYRNISVFVSSSKLRAVATEYASAIGFVSYGGTILNGSLLVLAMKDSTAESRGSLGSAAALGFCVTTAAILRNTSLYSSNSTLTSFGFYYSSALAVMSSAKPIDALDTVITSIDESTASSESDGNQVNAMAASVGLMSHDEMNIKNTTLYCVDSEVSALGSVRATSVGICNYQGITTISNLTTAAIRSSVLAKTLWNVNTLLSVVGAMSQNALKVNDVTMIAVNSTVQGLNIHASTGASVIAGTALGFAAYLSTIDVDRVIALAIGSNITVLSVALGITASVTSLTVTNLRVVSCASNIQVTSTSDGMQEIVLGLYPAICTAGISVVALASDITSRRCLSVFGDTSLDDSMNSSLRYTNFSCGGNFGSAIGSCSVPPSVFITQLAARGTQAKISTLFAGATFDPANALGPTYRVSGPTPNIALECPLFGQDDWVHGNRSTQLSPGFPSTPLPGPTPPVPCATVTSPAACSQRLGCEWEGSRGACLPKLCQGLNRTECSDNTWCSGGDPSGSSSTFTTQNCTRNNCSAFTTTSSCVATNGCWLSSNVAMGCVPLSCNGSDPTACPLDCAWEQAAAKCSNPVTLQPPTPAPTSAPPNSTTAPTSTSVPMSAAPNTTSPAPSSTTTSGPNETTAIPTSSSPAPTPAPTPRFRSRTHSLTLPVPKIAQRENPRLTSSSVGAVAQVLGKDAAVATVASATTSTVVAGLVNPTAAMQAGRIIAIASVSNCLFADADNTPSYFEHPIQVSLHNGGGGNADFALYAGSTLLSVICFIVFPMLLLLAGWLAGTRQTTGGQGGSKGLSGGGTVLDDSVKHLDVDLLGGGVDDQKPQVARSRPLELLQRKVISTTAFLGLGYFGPSVFKALFLVSWHSGASIDIVVVAISTCVVCFCVILLFRAVLFRAPSEVARGACAEKTKSEEMSNARPGSMFMETFGGLFDGARRFFPNNQEGAVTTTDSPWFDRITRLYFFEEFIVSSCLQMLEGIRPTSGSCVPTATCMLVVCLLHLGFLLVVRPYRERVELILSIIGAILLLVLSGVCVALSNYSAAPSSMVLGAEPPPESLTKALGILSLADMIYFFLQAIILGAVTLAGIHKKRLQHQWVANPNEADGTELLEGPKQSAAVLQVPVMPSATPTMRYDPQPHQVNANYNPLLAGAV